MDFRKVQSENYRKFVELIDEAESMLSYVTKTDIPYYILVDELEAYYGDSQIFKRDLFMIRDLIFTVKRFNTVFSRSEMKGIKVICSVRSEIINAISRFIVTKEVNKVVSGFSVPLNWNYANSSSYAHPIIQIILKRIFLCDQQTEYKSLEIYRRWFPEQIHISEFAKRDDKYIKNLQELVVEDEEIRVVIDDYNEKWKVWDLKIAEEI